VRGTIGRMYGWTSGQRMSDRGADQVLTYAELGERLALSPEAARAKAKREQKAGRWSILHGNDGRARVRLPAEALPDRPPDRTPKQPPERLGDAPTAVPQDVRADTADFAAELAALKVAVKELGDARARFERLQIEAVEARMDAVRAIAERDATKAATAAELAAMRQQVETEVATRNAVIEELRTMLADVRRPWWRRLVGA
jgi:hypothetical protein